MRGSASLDGGERRGKRKREEEKEGGEGGF